MVVSVHQKTATMDCDGFFVTTATVYSLMVCN